MKLLILCLLLSSCSVSYYYKGKEIDKSQKKANKQITKSLKSFKDFNKIDSVTKKLANSDYKNRQKVIKEIKNAKKVCVSNKNIIKNAQLKRNRVYKKLGIKKNKNYNNKHPKYEKIKSYIDSNKEYSQTINDKIKKANKDCKKIETVLKKYDLRIMDANNLYSQFSKYKSKLIKSHKKVEKELKRFKKKISKSNHPNKSQIKKELKVLDKIRLGMIGEVSQINKDVKGIKKQYGSKGSIPVIKGTKADKALKNLNTNIKQHNKKIKQFNAQIKKIEKLVNN